MAERIRQNLLLLLLLATAAATALAASGCGSSTSSSSPQESSPSPQESSSKQGGAVLGQASASFLKPNSPNNKFVNFGEEASSSVRETASGVLVKNLTSRESADFATQCGTLAAAAVKEIAGIQQLGKAESECPSALKKLAEPLSSTKEARTDTLGNGPIDALRIKGNRAYALYHGNDGKNWMMPMFEEGGAWKVGSILGTEIG